MIWEFEYTSTTILLRQEIGPDINVTRDGGKVSRSILQKICHNGKLLKTGQRSKGQFWL